MKITVYRNKVSLTDREDYWEDYDDITMEFHKDFIDSFLNNEQEKEKNYR
jgi:hypothetical protein